jgi:hypothetical protein
MKAVGFIVAVLVIMGASGFMAAGFYGMIRADGYPRLAIFVGGYFVLFGLVGVGGLIERV